MSKAPKPPPQFFVAAAHGLRQTLQNAGRKLAPAPFALADIVMGKWRAPCIELVARLGIADQLADGPRHVAELARICEVHEPSLRRVLRALARDGILDEPKPGSFALTPLSEPLRSDVEGSVRDTVLFMGSEWSRDLWSSLETSVRSGEPAFPSVFSGDPWTYFGDNPEQAQTFHGSMVELTKLTMPLVLGAYDFGQFRSVVDLGGGSGELLASILTAHPSLRGVNFDLEHAVKQAPATMRRAGVADRCEIVTGSVQDSAPAGHDAYVMKHIVHGFGDEQLRVPFENLRAAMKPHSKLLLIETLVPESGLPYPQFLDLFMLLGSDGGFERTRADFERLLRLHGFVLTEVVQTASPVAIIVAEQGG